MWAETSRLVFMFEMLCLSVLKGFNPFKASLISEMYDTGLLFSATFSNQQLNHLEQQKLEADQNGLWKKNYVSFEGGVLSILI